MRRPSGGFIGTTSCYNAGFLTVLNPDGDLLWSTYMGSGIATAVAFDPSGDLYVTGSLASLMPTRIGNGPSAAVSLESLASGNHSGAFFAGSLTVHQGNAVQCRPFADVGKFLAAR